MMPLYSFHCAECEQDSELLMGFSDTAVCPACGSQKMERLASRVAPDFKLKAKAKIWRAQAEREGHASNFSKEERKFK
jgi:putative FmdB family regulatory protein